MIMAVNFIQDVKRSFITEAHPLEVVTATVYPRQDVGSEATVPQKVTSCNL
jgi:hypothetical protein